MKRPLAVVAFTMLATLFVLCKVYSVQLVFCTVVVSVFLFIVFVTRKRDQTAFLPTVFMSAAAACLLLFCFQSFVYEPAVSLCSTNTEIKATVTDFPTQDGKRYHCTARIELPNSKIKTNIRLSFAQSSYYDEDHEEKITSLEPGDKVSFKGCIYVLGAGESSVMQSFKSKKLFLGAYPKGNVEIEKPKNRSPFYFLKKARVRTVDILLSSFDKDTAAVGISVLLGQKKYLSDELYSAFADSGVSHIMAVSGLHLSVWVLFIMRIIENAGLDKRKWSILLLAVNFLIMFFASFSGSVLRAGLMMTVYLFGNILKRNSDSLNSLGVSALLILLFNPYAAMNISFILSFLATLSIILVSAPLCARSEKIIEGKVKNVIFSKALAYCVSTCITSVCVSVFTFPVTLSIYGKLPLLFVLSNLLILPVSSFLIILFGLFVFLNFVPVLSHALKLLAWLVCSYCRTVVCFISSLKFSSVALHSETAVYLCALFAVLSVIVLLFVKYKRKTLSILVVAVLVFGSLFGVLLERHEKNDYVSVSVYDVADGLFVTVGQGGKSVLLFADVPEYEAAFIIPNKTEKTLMAVLSDDSFDTKKAAQFKPNFVAVPKSEDINLLGEEMRKTASLIREFEFGNVKIKLDTKTVFVNAYGLDISITKSVTETGDIIITNNEKNLLDYNKKSVIILSSDAPFNDCFSTADSGKITIKISKDAGYCVKGENSWRYLMKSC